MARSSQPVFSTFAQESPPAAELRGQKHTTLDPSGLKCAVSLQTCLMSRNGGSKVRATEGENPVQ